MAEVSKIEILGEDKLIARLLQLEAGIESRALTGVRRITEKIRDDAKDYVRINAWDTGSLHNSIRVQTSARPAGNIISLGVSAGGYVTNPKTGRKVDYAIYVHDGTRRMRSRPFFEHSINLNRAAYLDALKEEVFKI